MKTRKEIEQRLVELKPELVEKFSVQTIGYFGSFADGQQSGQSDLDLLVRFSKPIGWKFFTLEKFLEEHLGLSIDLVTEDALKSRFKEKILQQVRFV